MTEPLRDLVFLGPPGAGKGTQAQRASQRWGVPHISTGDLFREHLAAETPTGLVARGFMDRGLLVPDEIVCDMVWERLDEEDAQQGFILDGFPRTTGQAEALDGQLRRLQRRLLGVIAFDVSAKVLIERLSGRLTCGACGAVFHRTLKAPEMDGICDLCGADLQVREDDQPDAITARLVEYREKTAPLLKYYADRSLLLSLNAANPVDVVQADLEKALEGR